jgi:hypothetical protein
MRHPGIGLYWTCEPAYRPHQTHSSLWVRHVGMLRSKGMSPKQADLGGKTPRRIELRLPEELADHLFEEAYLKKCSVNSLILEKLEQTMPKRKKK